MESDLRYPVLDVDLDAVRSNAAVIGSLCARYGIEMAGVIKFSDGSVEIAKAYRQGGCRQIASSRVVHLKGIKEAMPDTELSGTSCSKRRREQPNSTSPSCLHTAYSSLKSKTTPGRFLATRIVRGGCSP